MLTGNLSQNKGALFPVLVKLVLFQSIEKQVAQLFGTNQSSHYPIVEPQRQLVRDYNILKVSRNLLGSQSRHIAVLK